jgi:DNA polymerase
LWIEDRVEAEAQLAEIAREIAGCTACALSRTRHKTVPGDGVANAEILFIGEAPGYHEDQQGKPFVGQAGQFLQELLQSIDLERSSVFIANVVKCRPPNNRDPLPDEIAACDQFLQRQIAAINPKVVVTLGRYSMAKFFPGESISRIHGQARTRGSVMYVPMYHPAAALHQPALRRTIEEDFRKLPGLLATLRVTPAESEPEKPSATQLSLF